MRKIRRLLRGNSRGVTLIEALVAMAIVSIIAVAFLGGLATASRSAARADIRTNAESLARTQMEYVKSQSYSEPDWEYEVPHNGYRIEVKAQALPKDEDTWFPTIQQIKVTVFHHSSEDTPVFELTGYKTNVKE